VQTILEASGLSFAYPEHVLFTDWSMRISPGVSLIKCDESRGKTTLIKLLAAEVPAKQGRLAIKSIGLDRDPVQYRSEVFYIEPRSEEFDQISAMDFFAEMQKKYPAFNTEKLLALISGLSLSPHRDKPLYMLSAGSKRKVWIAAALACGAAVSLIDDVFAALDLGSIEFITDQLVEHARHRDRVCIIAHYDEIERLACTSVIPL
jgi:ABC-type multidrug transport system ATPase subunit